MDRGNLFPLGSVYDYEMKGKYEFFVIHSLHL